MTDSQRSTRQNEMRGRVRTLLAERFRLSIHRESKEAPVYALVVARGGSKLQVAKPAGDGPQGLRMNRGPLTGMSAPLSMLANTLASQVGRPVIDKTELEGKYDFKLEWTPDAGMGVGQSGPLPPGAEVPTPAPPLTARVSSPRSRNNSGSDWNRRRVRRIPSSSTTWRSRRKTKGGMLGESLGRHVTGTL